MRVLRVVLGILTLLLAMPVLAAGTLGWWVMQHRSPDGAFHADLAPIAAVSSIAGSMGSAAPAAGPAGDPAEVTPEGPIEGTMGSRVVVIPDVDALLRRDAPFARADQTELRLTAEAGTFVGMARAGDLAAYLTGVDYTDVAGVSLGRGPLAVRTRQVSSAGEPIASPAEQSFWLRSGKGELRWDPVTDQERQVGLILVAPPGDSPIRLNVAVTAGWLDTTTWGLLILGPVLLLLGLVALAWPQRTREIVYVVDGSAAVPPTRLPQAGLPYAGLPYAGFPQPGLPQAALPPARLPARRGPGVDVGLDLFATPGVPHQPSYESMPAPEPASAVSDQTALGEAGQAGPGRMAWPPAQASMVTEAPRQVAPDVPAEDAFAQPGEGALPMPTAGMQLHLSRPE